jgi:hypothetical protein
LLVGSGRRWVAGVEQNFVNIVSLGFAEGIAPSAPGATGVLSTGGVAARI